MQIETPALKPQMTFRSQNQKVMVRQDKITYLITAFKIEGTEYLHRKEAPLECLIRTVLSQTTNDENRDRSFAAMKARYPGWGELAKSSLPELEETLRSGGLARRKAETIHAVLRWAQANFGSYTLDPVANWETPKLFAELTKIPGVGVKTVAIVACFSLGRGVFPVDVHVHRVLNRLGVTSRKLSPEQTFTTVDPFIPFNRDAMLHLNLIELGRHLCKARQPLCEACRFRDICDYYLQKNDWAVK